MCVVLQMHQQKLFCIVCGEEKEREIDILKPTPPNNETH